MRSEIFVVSLVKASGRARVLVSDVLNSWVMPSRDDLLYRLPFTETLERLAVQLKCARDEVFTRLAARMKRYIEGRPTPLFDMEHLRQLVDAETHKRLAKVLMCEPQQVLNELFDVRAILDTLFEVEPIQVLLQLMPRRERDTLLPSAEIAVHKLLENHQRIAEHYHVRDLGWGRFLEEHRWIRNSALGCLRRYAAEQGIAQDTGANLLAAAIGTRAYDGKTDEAYFDALAIIHLQQRIQWIVRQLREQTQELARAAKDLAPSRSLLTRLWPHLEFYELKAPAIAWRALFEGEKSQSSGSEPTLREKIPGIDIHSTGASGTPKPESHPRVRTEQIWSKSPGWQFWKRPQVIATRLVVSVEITEQDRLVDVLSCSHVPVAQLASLEKLFTSLQMGAVSQGRVSDIGTRLLNTRFITLGTFQDALRDACIRLLPELIQALILSGVDLPGGLNPMWGEHISYQQPVLPLESGQDSVFPMSRSGILNLVRDHYPQSLNLKIIV